MKIYLRQLEQSHNIGDGLRILPEKETKKTRVNNKTFFVGFAPSIKLQKWYNYNPERWGNFRNNYLHELRFKKVSIKSFISLNSPQVLTILYSNHLEALSFAKVLKEYIAKLKV